MTQRKSSNKRRHGRPAKGRHGRPRPGRPDQRAEVSPWLYGLHAVQAALANPDRRFTRLLVTVNVAEKIGNAPIAAEIVEREIIDAVLPDGAVHQGIALLAAPLPEADITAVAQEC